VEGAGGCGFLAKDRGVEDIDWLRRGLRRGLHVGSWVEDIDWLRRGRLAVLLPVTLATLCEISLHLRPHLVARGPWPVSAPGFRFRVCLRLTVPG
jgi:hypothetical protein